MFATSNHESAHPNARATHHWWRMLILVVLGFAWVSRSALADCPNTLDDSSCNQICLFKSGHIWECDLERLVAGTAAGTYEGNIVFAYTGSTYDYVSWGVAAAAGGTGSVDYCCEYTDNRIDLVMLLGTGKDDTLSFQFDEDASSFDNDHHGAAGVLQVEGRMSGRADADDMTGSRVTANDYEDRLHGDAGNDTMRGDQGADHMEGGTGEDTMDGDADNDFMEGDEGDDTMKGGADNDTMYGNEGEDVMNGDAGEDDVNGGEHDDIVCGGTNDDTLIGYTGNFDKLYDVSGAGQTGNAGAGTDDTCGDGTGITCSNHEGGQTSDPGCP